MESNLVNYQSDKVKIIEEPEKIQIMFEDTRRTILAVLGKGIEEANGKKRYSMSVAEITHQLNALKPISNGKQRFKQTAIYHHIEILKEAGFITIDQEASGVTTFYRRTAPVFVVSSVFASNIDIVRADEPMNEKLKIKSQKLLRSFDLSKLPESKIKEFEQLMNAYYKKVAFLDQKVANDVKSIDIDDAIELYKFIRFFWACSDPEMVDIASKVKDFLLDEKI